MKQFLRYIFTFAAMFVATTNAWAECYVIEDKEITLKYQDRNSNGTGVSQTIDFSNGATLSFTYYIEKWAGGEHRLIVEGWDGTKWNELLNENIQYQTDPKTATNKDVTKYSKIRFTRTAYKGWSDIDAGKQTIKVTNIDITRIVSISASPTPLPAFAPTAVNSTSAPQEATITYSNIGTTSNITSTNSTDFSISPTSTTFDACTGKATFNITFHPKGTTGGTRTGSFTIAGRETGSTTNKASITINVSGTAKGLPTHTWTGATEYMVDQTINLSELWTSKSSGARTFRVVSFQETGINNEGGTTPSTSLITSTANGYTLKLNKAGTLKLAMDQVNDEVYSAHSSEITLTIKKHTPVFIWNGKSVNVDQSVLYNTHYDNYFQSSSTKNLENMQFTYSSSNTDVATLSAGDAARSLDLTVYNKPSTITLTASQTENWYWYAKTETHTITPKHKDNHVPFTIDSENKMSIVFHHSHNKDLYWNNGINLRNTDGIGFDWEDNYIILEFSGIPDKLFFSTATQTGATDVKFIVSEGKSHDNLTEIYNKDKTESNVTLKLNPETRYIKLCYSGNLNGYFRGTDSYKGGVSVTELNEFYAVETSDEETKTEIEHLYFNEEGKPNQIHATTTRTFDIKYANAGYKVTAISNDNHFTVTPATTNQIGGEKHGLYTFTVNYTAREPYSTTDNNSYITLTDELGHKDIVYLHASSDKFYQTLRWKDEIAAVGEDKPYVVRKTVGEIINAAIASSDLTITYESTNKEVIKVEGTKLILVGPGETTITAKQNGNDLYYPADSISKQFVVTDKLLQYIIWNDAPTDIIKTDGTQQITLTAQVYVQTEDENNPFVLSPERTKALTYKSANTNIISVAGNILTVGNIGKTTLTAQVPETEEYAAAELTVPVTVRNETAGCEDILLYGPTEEPIQFFQYDLNEIAKEPIALDRTTGIPGYVELEHYGESWNLVIQYYAAEIRVEESVDGQNWTNKKTIYPVKNQINKDTINLSRNATHIRFVRNYGGQGYQFLQDIKVHPAQYLETYSPESTTAIEEIDFGEIHVGSKNERSFDVHYSNIKSELSPVPSHSDITATPNFGYCGAFGTQTIKITWTPSSVKDNAEETIKLWDQNSGMEKTVKLKARIKKGPQNINWSNWGGEAPTTISHCNLIEEFPTMTTADLPIKWEVTDGTEFANFVAGTSQLQLIDNGTITLKASSGETDTYLAFEQTFTITIEAKPIFLGTMDSNWDNVANWNFNRLPCEEEIATLQAPATLSSHATIAGLIFVESGKLHITSVGGMTIGAEGITNAATNGNSITIDNTREGAGFLRISPAYKGTMPYITMRYQTKSTLDSGANKDATWQYIGAPGADCSIYVDHNTWLYLMDEHTKDGWVLQGRNASVDLQPFAGYAITQYGQPTYEWTAQLTNANYTLPLTYTKSGRSGRHIFANSYTAPIDIKALDGQITGDEERFRIEKTIYIFNSGSWNQWNNAPQDGDGTPGQYYAIPISAAAKGYIPEQTVIPPMQGFYMRVRSKTALAQLEPTETVGEIVLDYNQLIMGDGHSNMHTPMRTPQRFDPINNAAFKRIRIHATSANSGADRLYVIQDTICTSKYDNGYDATNQATSGLVNIYTNESAGKMEVSCSNNMDSIYIGFMAGEDSQYTLHFGAECGNIYLKDLENDSIFRMQEDEPYHFTAVPNSTNDLRFQILLYPLLDYQRPEIGEEDKLVTNVTDIPMAQIWSDGNYIYIANAPIDSTVRVYNISGYLLSTIALDQMPYTLDLSHLTAGVYMIQVNNQVYKFICK